jgi:predicted phage tail component-like protein
MSYILYNGIDSRDFGLTLINNGVNKYNFMPPKEIRTTDIIKFAGSIVSQQNYKKAVINLRFKLSDATSSNKNLIASWMGGLGEGELVISDESHKKYIGVFEQLANVEEYLNGGILSIDFILYKPLARSRFTTKDIIDNGLLYDYNFMYDSGLLYDSQFSYIFETISAQTNLDVYNGSTIAGSKPRIVINGSADSIIINKYKTSARSVLDNYFSYDAFNGELEINCENKVTLLDGDLVTNPTGGDYFSLDVNDFIRMSKGEVIINTPTIIELDSRESDTDDYYNGYYISVRENEILKSDWYEILDYNGTTKEITINGGSDKDYDRYSIYDISGSVNNFEIDGVNLNITSIEFIFEFLY